MSAEEVSDSGSKQRSIFTLLIASGHRGPMPIKSNENWLQKDQASKFGASSPNKRPLVVLFQTPNDTLGQVSRFRLRQPTHHHWTSGLLTVVDMLTC
jgi:hypothetical protein